uniref:RNA-directed DNA polymerase n=1 Tax=Photinus pyralis TaxID=7054 RepID=A0A1Y1N3D6_PHOPY
MLQRLGLAMIPETTICTVANGDKCYSSGYITTPITLKNKTVIMNLLVIPDLCQDLLLGIDFWKAVGIIPILTDNVWHFTPSPSIVRCGVIDHPALSLEQTQALETLLDTKFSTMGSVLGLTTVGEHEIIVPPDVKPIKQRYYPVSPVKQKIINEAVDDMLENGVIEPSKSAWASPICLIPKKDHTYRFCVDYRKLNAVTAKDSYPIPYLSSILDQLRDARYLSSLDIKSAYWQVGVAESSRQYTAFTVPGRGLFQFRRMPFGLTNAPSTWMRIIDNILGIDLKTLSLVFDRLQAAGLVVNRDKCHFCRPELKYLGYVVDYYGLHPDPDKVKAILEIRIPTTIKELRSFLGVCSWYRRFLPGFATVATPLTDLLKKNVKFEWSAECGKSFQHLKELLSIAPVLQCPDFDKPFVLQTDASAYGLGAVLTQTFEDGEKVIAYLSRSLTRTERNYSTTERECLAVIWSIEQLRHYLEGVHFTVVTDHHSLLWLHSLKDPQGRLARWALRLQPYTFTLVHRKGKENLVPDFLSRSVPVHINTITQTTQTELESFKNTTDTWYKNMFTNLENAPHKYPGWRVENDLLYKHIKRPSISTEYENWKLVVPRDCRMTLLHTHHDEVTSGHLGVYKTFWRLQTRYYWPKMLCDIKRYISRCEVCAQHKADQQKPAGLMGNRPKVYEAWQMISLDFMGPFPRSTKGHTHILVISDYFSKFVLLFPVRAATAQTLVKCVEDHVFLMFGVPQFIVCDNGVQMRSKLFINLCDQYHVKILFTPLYYPKADPAERVNRVVKQLLSTFIKDNHRHWDASLSAIACALRTARHESTQYTPYFTNFGKEHRIRGDSFETDINTPSSEMPTHLGKRIASFQNIASQIVERLKKVHIKNKRDYNLRRRHVEYNIGTKVWRKNKSISDATKNYTAKLTPKYLGPFTIRKKIGYLTYELQDSHNKFAGTWHVQDLKPYLNDDHG